MSTEFDPAELSALLEAILGGDVGPAERARLEAILAGNRAARRYYARSMLLRALLVQDGGGTRGAEPPPARVGRGRGAPADVREDVLASPIDGDDERAVDLGPRQLGLRRPFAFPTRLAAAAALLVMGSLALATLGRGWMGRPAAPPSVATLVRTIGARWDGPPVPDGRGLAAGATLALAGGYAELAFPGGARVIVEGPARLSAAESAVALAAGKLAATVPGGGFVVRTPGATVTDLGTAFAVELGSDGATEVSVFAGRVSTAPRGEGFRRLIVSGGQAARVTGATVALDPAGADPQRFVRSLDPVATALDVADLVCGGDGLTRRRGQAIDVLTGEVGLLSQVADRVGDRKYHRVPARPAVDGCFVPDGRRGPVQVDSTGHRFAFPATSNATWYHLWAGGPIPDVREGHPPEIAPILGGVDYSRPGHGLLFLHSNKGITLDLDAVRRLHPASDLAHFRCTVGNSYPGALASRADARLLADAFVLVDGAPRLQARGLAAQGAPVQVDVPLGRADRFLTLAVTDGGDRTGGDWILWGDPRLEPAARAPTRDRAGEPR